MEQRSAKFHIDYGPDVLFERILYKMDSKPGSSKPGGVTVAMTGRFLERAKQRKIPQEIIERIREFQVGTDTASHDILGRYAAPDSWNLVACEVCVETGKFITSIWETEYIDKMYWLTIGPGDKVEDVSLRRVREDGGEFVTGGDLYDYVRAVNRGLMEDVGAMG